MFFIVQTILGVLVGSVGFYFLSKYVLINLSPMILNIVKVALVGVIILFAYINYDSIDSKMILTETVELRNTAVQKRLTQISDAQVEYKKVRGTYAGSFNDLIDFLKNDSVVQVKMEGEVPDSLLGQEALALELGIIRRDTTKIPVKEILFTDNFNNIVDSMPYIPFAEGKQFTIATSSIEKNKLKMPVFQDGQFSGHFFLKFFLLFY